MRSQCCCIHSFQSTVAGGDNANLPDESFSNGEAGAVRGFAVAVASDTKGTVEHKAAMTGNDDLQVSVRFCQSLLPTFY